MKHNIIIISVQSGLFWSRNISTANLKQDDESVGDCDADCHDKDEVVDDEHLVRREKDKAPTDTWLAFTL